MKLDHYQFPIGNKRPLQKDLEKCEGSLKQTKRCLNTEIFENQQLSRHNHQLEEHNIDLQYRKLMPVLNTAINLSTTSVETFRTIDIHSQVFGVRMMMPHINTTESSFYNYTKMVIEKCAGQLAQEITKYIVAELSKVHDRVELEKKGYKCMYL